LFIDRLLVDPGGRLRREPDRKQSSLLSIQQQASAPPAPADRRDCIMRLQRNRRPSRVRVSLVISFFQMYILANRACQEEID
jgi:hypothetical protein